MGSTFQLTLCLGMLALCFASPVTNIRWCVKSIAEYKKCNDVGKTCGSTSLSLSCVLKESAEECYKAISEDKKEADAVTLDGGEVYRSSLKPYELKPIAAENYGTDEPDTCYYAVAVVSKSSDFQFKDLKDKKTCHTAIGRAAGWVSIVGLIFEKNLVDWEGPDSQPAEKAIAEFFSAACVPGAKQRSLCSLCAGTGENKCKASPKEPYFGYDGALDCLKNGTGQVAFVKHILPADLSNGYELLCPEDKRSSINDYKNCYTSRVPAHAVVTQDKEDKIKAVLQFLEEAQKKPGCKLLSSEYGRDLLFKSTAKSVLPLPSAMDAFLYLGKKFYDANKALHSAKESTPKNPVRWCTQGTGETNKCDTLSVLSESIVCIEASSAEDCITKVLKGEADAVTLDGGYQYTAGECGLVPVMQEIYDADVCKQRKLEKKGTYSAVAVVKKSNKAITLKNLRNSKSCHTGVGRTAGYNVPAGFIRSNHDTCDLSTFFKESCIPGADRNSNLCSLCAGNPEKSGDTKCLANSQELYFGYTGAFRCLVEQGEVAFVKDSTVPDFFKNQNPPAWIGNLKKDDFELLCRDGSRQPIDNHESCNLAVVPPHSVVATPEKKKLVEDTVKTLEQRFGRNGSDKEMFQLFTSEGGNDQMFKDSTQCLREVKESSMKDFLGDEYYSAVTALNKCGKTGLLAACTFHTCKL